MKPATDVAFVLGAGGYSSLADDFGLECCVSYIKLIHGECLVPRTCHLMLVKEYFACQEQKPGP